MGELKILPVEQLTKAAQVFRCVPYSCAMAARRCVERQAQAESKFPPPALVLCKGCSLGAQVKARIGSQVLIAADAGARATKADQRPPNPFPRAAAPASKPTQAERRSELALERAAALVDHSAPVATGAAPDTAGLHPLVVDMTGKSIAGVKVLRKGEPSEDGALWVCEFPCGHTREILGTHLRATERNGATRRCPECGNPREPVEMVGRELCGVRVLREGGKNHAGRCWVVEHIDCGHIEEVPGQVLRATEKNGTRKRGCNECRELEPGEQQRELAQQQEVSQPDSTIDPPSPAPSTARVARAALSSRCEKTVYSFPLRRDFLAIVDLPTDLTKSDVTRLSRWLETLVFEE